MNAAIALAALDALAAAGGPIVSDGTRARGLANVTHPGRFELISEPWLHPGGHMALRLEPIILDAAHNPHGAKALADALRERGETPTLLIGVSADKDIRAILRALLPAVGTVVTTRAENERAMPPEDLAALVREVSAELGTPNREVIVEYRHDPHHQERIMFALASASRPPAKTVVAGSLFLVGEVREILLGGYSDPAIATDPSVGPKP
jgi:dihydrofolate synthase / folylpolyglutamate synthase